MGFSGQPYADARASQAATAEPTLDQVMAEGQGLGPGNRDPFAPPQAAPAGPAPTIAEIQSASQPMVEQPSNFALDFQDPVNLFAPSSGPVADAYRGLQQQYAADLADEPPLSPIQILGLTMSAIANPQAVQEVLKARRQRVAQRSRDRRTLNMKLMEMASNSVAMQADLELKQTNLRLDAAKTESAILTDRKQRAVYDAEIPLKMAMRQKYEADAKRATAQADTLGRFGNMDFNGGAPAGMEAKGIRIGSNGLPSFNFGPEDSARELYENAVKFLAPKDSFGQAMETQQPQLHAKAFAHLLRDPKLSAQQRRDLLSIQRDYNATIAPVTPDPQGEDTLGGIGAVPESLQRAYPGAQIEPLF